MNPAKRQEIYSRLRAANPHPTTELEYTSPFQLLIAVILSAQATDKSVNAATRKLFPVAGTPQAIQALGVAGLSNYIRTIGLYNAKAKNVIATCEILLRDHSGEVPRDRAALEALPGVGRKTANVVLNTAFGEPTIAVDTHIFRIANRTGLGPGKTPLAVEEALLKFTPAEFRQDAHHWLILHGRYVCLARKPPLRGVHHRRPVRVQAQDESRLSMPIFATQSREALRRQYLNAWEKFRAQQTLTPLETQLAAVVTEHPEYHPLFDRGGEALGLDWQPEHGQLNPFLHLGMHLAIREQVGTNRPAGITAVHAKLTKRVEDAHAAEHRMMEALGTALWEAQRFNRPPDEAAYLETLRKLI